MARADRRAAGRACATWCGHGWGWRELPAAAACCEGGTWSAGRHIAARRRADGPPPIVVAADGTVF